VITHASMSAQEDFRCDKCRDVLYQCSDCVNDEKATKRALRDSQKSAKAAANPASMHASKSAKAAANPASTHASMSAQEDFRCDKCRGVMYQCSDCVDLEKATKKSLKDVEKRASILAQNRADSSKQQTFLSLVRNRYKVKAIPRDGDCIFKCILVDQERISKQKGAPLTISTVRDSVAAHLVSEITSKGYISGQTYEFFEKNEEGVFVNYLFEHVRGEAAANSRKQAKKKAQSLGLPIPTPPTLEEYAAKIRSGMYGGDLEILLLASLYNLTIHVFSWHYFDGQQHFAPQVFGSGPRVVSVLFEQDFSGETGGKDHYHLILSQKFTKWETYMSNMPKWNKDIGLCQSRGGRGIAALRNFKKGDVILYYDGHRIDSKGNLATERASVTRLYKQFGVESTLPLFQSTHAVCLGRTHITDQLIDGYPFTLSNFDDVEIVGRGALANSGTAKESNMKMVWVEAPDLPPDFVDHLRDCEAFLVASRDIRCVNFSLSINAM
jgi:hypothetical protein